MASSPITSWQIEEQKVKTVTDFIFLGSKITVEHDCIHEILATTLSIKYCYHPQVPGIETEAQKMLNHLVKTMQLVRTEIDI